MLHIISRLHHESKHSVCRCTSHSTLTPPVWGVGLCFSLPEDAGLSMCWCLRHRISNWTWALYQSHYPPYSTTCLSWSTAHSPPELVAGRFSSLPWPTRCTPDTVPPPDPSLPPCPGRGPAESAPVGQPLPCWWRSGKASQTSADPQALKRHRNKLQKEISVNCAQGAFLSSGRVCASQRDILPAACPVLARRVPNSRMLCSLTLTASSSFSWTSLLTGTVGQQGKVNTVRFNFRLKLQTSAKNTTDRYHMFLSTLFPYDQY